LVRVTINAITPGDIANPPAGIDPVQPSYLNIEVALLSAPKWPLKVCGPIPLRTSLWPNSQIDRSRPFPCMCCLAPQPVDWIRRTDP
jgi:hypothetical protein